MEEVPHNCPGVNTESAGKVSACQGCPNQSICSSGKSGEDPDKQLILDRMKDVKRKLLILSGKGGVGKSTMTMLLARYIANKFKEQNFGVLDLDICGPSQPRMLGVENEQVHQSGSGWSPVNVDDNLCVMSIGFLLSSPDDAIIWRGPKKNGLIKQFLGQVDWGNLDCLFIDTPPGTSDEHLSAVSYLNSDKDDVGAIIVTTPQEVSLLDVRKEISFCRKLKIPIIGVIENMSRFHCGKCNKISDIFPALTGGAEAMCKQQELDFLGSLPLDSKVGEMCDSGDDSFALAEETKASLEQISKGIAKILL